MTKPSCELCGGPVIASNKYGVCRRNPECLKESKRRHHQTRNEARRDQIREYQAGLRQQRREERERDGEITYLIWSPLVGLYKIGHTVNLDKRLTTLKCGLPGHIEVLAIYPAGRTLEHFLHEVFSDLREGDSEWFRLPVEPELAAPTIWEFSRVYWESKGEIPPKKYSIFPPTGELVA